MVILGISDPRKERESLSFFDEADEPEVTPRTAPRSRRPSGTGRRPPSDQQAILVRRAIAAGVLLVVVILIVVGVHSCQVSARNSSLHDYANGVSSLITESNQTGAQLFNALNHAGAANNPTQVYNSILDTSVPASNQVKKARAFNVPDEMKAAQQWLLLTMQMRADGIGKIASNIQQALGTTTSKDAVNTIAAEMARLYSSDVVYKDYMLPQMIGGLKSAGISLEGVPIQKGQFVPDVQWVQPAFVASKLGASTTSSSGTPAPGVHGHSLDSVSVGGTTLQTGSTNTLPANPPPTFTFHYTNGGDNDERNVAMSVSLSGSSVTGQTVVPLTSKGQSGTADVKLNSSPPAGNYTLTAKIATVPGEKNSSNNTLTFPVTFQ
jgi:hypothetical protein